MRMGNDTVTKVAGRGAAHIKGPTNVPGEKVDAAGAVAIEFRGQMRRRVVTQLLVIAICFCAGWFLCAWYGPGRHDSAPTGPTYDEEIAAEARTLVLLRLGQSLHAEFSNIRCPLGDENAATCWAPSLDEFTFDGGGGYQGTLSVSSRLDDTPLARARAKYAVIVIGDLCWDSLALVLHNAVTHVTIWDSKGTAIAHYAPARSG